MLTVDDLSPGQQLPASLDVTVTGVERNPAMNRQAHIHLVDGDGTPIRLVDYQGAEISIDWREGHRYRISRCGVQLGGGGYDLELAPSSLTRIEPLGPATQRIQLLVLGDSHVGRKTHPGTGTEINPVEAFVEAVKYGIDQDISAVVHVGDIFHESATSFEAQLVDQFVFKRLERANIPFYYIRGNHAASPGDELLTARSGNPVSHLDTTGTPLGSAVCLFGIDHHAGGNLPWSTLSFPASVEAPVSILVIHQTIKQLSGSTPSSVNLGRIQRRYGNQFDAVLCGHHHDSLWTCWRGCEVLYTGSVERMSTNPDPTDRVAWLLTVEDGLIDLEQYDIP
jgi:predicted phosphodiesterase